MIAKSVCVIGLGYVGLPTAALLASEGYQVWGTDLNKHIVDAVNRGECHIAEKNLEDLISLTVTNGSLKASIKPEKSDIYIICVPTPCHYEGGKPEPNTNFIFQALESIINFLKVGDLLILESTAPVGTTKKIEALLLQKNPSASDIFIGYSPERVLPGNILKEMVNNDRVVGGNSTKSTDAIAEFYKTFVQGKVLKTDSKTAELCKLAENSFRDINIAFANELSIVCDNENINVWDLISLANLHPRVNILQPGVGVGGHCIAVDPWFIVSKNPEDARLIKMSRKINDEKKYWVLHQIKIEVKKFQNANKQKPIIACLGLTFKSDIDDMRNSPADIVATQLLSEGYDIIGVEPNIEKHDKIKLMKARKVQKIANIFVVLVKHKEFIELSKVGYFEKLITLDFCGVIG